MNISVFAYSRQGCRTARQVISHFSGSHITAYTMERFAEPGFFPLGKPAEAFYGSLFAASDVMVFIGSCGIAVRQIARHVKSKQTDPAVLVVDELGTFVIPLLSGHMGGANRQARALANTLGATPVVTTATDINKRFSVDSWAAENGFIIDSMACAKAVSAAILEKDIPMLSDFPVVTDYPNGVIPGNQGDLGIYVGYCEKMPFAQTLRLIPRVLQLGIGCRRNTPASAIREAVEQVFKTHQIDRRAIRCAASINLKADEEGLLQFCREAGLPVSFYSAAELSAVPGDFTPSPFVAKVTGVNNVCERSALLGADRLIVKKTARNGVTVAIAVQNLEVHFG